MARGDSGWLSFSSDVETNVASLCCDDDGSGYNSKQEKCINAIGIWNVFTKANTTYHFFDAHIRIEYSVWRLGNCVLVQRFARCI